MASKKKAKSKQATSRFRNLLPDIDDITKKILENDLDPSQALEISSAVDDQVDWAPNFLVWCQDRRFLGMTPYAKQVEMMLHLFEEHCVYCSDLDYAKSIPVEDRIDQIRAKVVFMEHGKCPVCDKTKGQMREDGYFKSPLEMVAVVGQRAGKCVAGDTEIFTDTGRRTAEEMVDKHFSVVTKTADHKIIHSGATAFKSGEKDCVRMTLADGSSVTLSTDHPVFTPDGWVHAGKMVVGDLAATPRHIPQPEKCLEISRDEVILSAYLLSDGGVSQPSTKFTNITPEVIDEFTEVSTRLGDGKRNVYRHQKVPKESYQEIADLYERGSSQFEIADLYGVSQCTISGILSGKRDRSKSKSGVHKDGKYGFRANGLQWFRQKWDLYGLAKNKRLTASLWGMSNDDIALFINRFWSCDGYFEDRGVGITLASEKMIDDLKFLLLRLGVRTSKKYKLAKCQTGSFDAWRLSATGRDALTFMDKVGPVLGKEAAGGRLRIYLEGIKRNTRYDRVPINRREIKSIANEIEVDRGERCGHAMREFTSAKSKGSISRQMFEKMCAEFDYSGELSWLAETELFWEKVVSIESVGVLPVFDLSVPETKCFVGNNIVLHNSALASMVISYLLHRTLFIPTPWKEYGLLPGQLLDFAIVATTVGQAEVSLWASFKNMFTGSTWFRNYMRVCNEQAKASGAQGDAVKVLETFIKFDHKNILVRMAAANAGALRGATRIGSAIDELAYFASDSDSVRANGPETYTSLNNSCLTLRGKLAKEIKRNPECTWPPTLMVNISSPKEMNDPIMTVYREAIGNDRIISRHWATWEMSPELTKQTLVDAGESKKPNFMRNYGAQPPLADDPLIKRTDTITGAFQRSLAMEERYGPVIRPSLLGYSERVYRQVGNREEYFTTGGLLNDLVPLDLEALKNISDEDRDALGSGEDLFNELLERPPSERMHALGIDLGHTNNSLAIVAGYLACNGTKFITDFALELEPTEDSPIDIVDVQNNIIFPLVERLNVVTVHYDTWNSLQPIQELAAKYGSLGPLNDKAAHGKWLRQLAREGQRPEFLAATYSLNMADANMVASRMMQGDCLFPQMEIPFMDLVVNTELASCDYPYTALAVQCATVRAKGNRLLKPINRNDDLFRAWTNAVVPAFKDELVIDLLKQPYRGTPSRDKAATGFHVSLGQAGKGLRQVGTWGGNAPSNNRDDGFPIVTRKGKY